MKNTGSIGWITAFIFMLLHVKPVLAQKPAEAELAGTYMLQGVMETAAGFQLHPDHTFEYMFTYGAADKWGKGTWKQVGSGVVLSGDHPLPASDFMLKASNASHPGKIKILIKDNKGRVYQAVAFKLGQQETVTNTRGEAFFNSIADGKLQVYHPVYSLRVSEIMLNKKDNDFLIAPVGDLTEVIFENFMLELQDDALMAGELPGMPSQDKAGQKKRYVFRRQ